MTYVVRNGRLTNQGSRPNYWAISNAELASIQASRPAWSKMRASEEGKMRALDKEALKKKKKRYIDDPASVVSDIMSARAQALRKAKWLGNAPMAAKYKK